MPMTSDAAVFTAALAHVLHMEGGYTDDPHDPGGPTNLGITLADFARSRGVEITPFNRTRLIDELRVATPATVSPIYLSQYWEPAGCAALPPPLAFFHFDTAVNMGVGTAIRMLQTALGGFVDGAIGPATIAAAAGANPAALLEAYAGLRRQRYRSLATFPRFGRGWLTRVDATLHRALAISTPSPTQGDHTMPTDQPATPQADPKWWGQSTTIWGAVVTGLAAVLPAFGPALGVSITPDTVTTGAGQIAAIVQAMIGLAGTIAAIRGRLRATAPLVQRTVTVRV